MGRCGCESVGATGAAMGSTNCINVTGAGSALDPFVPTLVLDPASDNLLVCGSDGLYARTPAQVAGDDSMLVTPGVGAGDYSFIVQVDDDDANFEGEQLLALFAGGLGVDSWGDAGDKGINVGFLSGDTPLAGTVPNAEDCFLKVIAGTQVVALDVNGNGVVTFPGGGFSQGLLSFVPTNGDAGTPPWAPSLGAPVSLTAHGIHCEPIVPTNPVASTNVRVTYIAVGV